MKNYFLFACLLSSLSLAAQKTTHPAIPVQSNVYAWENLRVEKKPTSERRLLFDGSGAALSNLEIHATTIDPGSC